MDYAFPALFALFVWWFSTGVIIYLDGLPKHTFRWSMLGATLLFAGSLYGLAETRGDDSVAGAYWAFTFGLTAWAWQEISFYMGYVTGPRKEVCPEGCRGWRHFLHAIQTSLWHELAIIASAAAVVAVTWNGANQVGTWTFMILWWMHQSAKLNVFLGVRNLNEEFLPEHLAFLKGFLTKRSMNLLFPVSITVSTVALAWLVQLATAPGASAFELAGFTFLATMMGLAVLEHWFLVVPLPSAVLWHWGLASRGKTAPPFEVEIACGFLGAGKTSFLRRRLANASGKRTVALVNDFGELAVDGALLRGQGAEVVELPNGCICCSLRKDLAQQLREIVLQWQPERVIIEPSGVADIAALLGVLNADNLRKRITRLRLFNIVDASAFLQDYAQRRTHFEVQARLAPVFVLNKTDLATPGETAVVRETLHRLNPAAEIVPAVHGEVSAAQAPGLEAGCAWPEAGSAEHSHHPGSESHQEAALGLQSLSVALEGNCDIDELHALLEAVAGGFYGDVERVKGIARAGAGWIHFDVAGGRPSIAAFAPHESDTGRVMAIGRHVDGAALKAAFENCALPAMRPAQASLRALG